MRHILNQTLTILTEREKKQWGRLTLLTLVISVADIASLALLVYIVHFYAQTDIALPSPANFFPERLAHWLFNRHSVALIAVFFAFFSVKNVAAYLVNKKQTNFVYQVASRISHNNLLQYLEGNYSDYIHTDSSVHIRKISLQPLEFCQHVLASMQQLFTEEVLIVLTIIAILVFNAQLFLLLLIILLPPVILAAWLTKRKLSAARNYIKSSRTLMWQHLHESIAGFVESNIYDKNLFFTERYTAAQHALNMHQSNLQSVQALPARLAEVFAVFGLLALITISSISGNMQYATQMVTWGAFIAAAYKIIPGIARILNSLGQIRTYAFTLKDLVQTNKQASLKNDIVPAIHTIAFQQVAFQYNPSVVPSPFTCNIQPGDFVGIEGHSGKGKTTLLNILLGFISPEQGQVLINNKPTSSEERQLYWKQIAYVKQQPFFMYDTLLTNITLNGKHYDAPRLQQSLNIAGISDWLHQLPAGMNTLLTENGKNISGGQRQRISLARALYKNADLFILDEPFSELDEKSEEKLLHHLQQLAAAGKMIILITHNKKSLAWCNKIIAL
jgi:ABC-type multidrug transport system fused ATPase/permease subunit